MKKIIHLLPILLILPLVILGLLDLLKNSSNRLQAADGDTITVTINPAVIKNNDFAQLLGGYISTRANLNPTSKFLLSQPSVVDAAKKMFPQPPEFPNPVVLRTQSFHMLSNDYFVITDAEVEDVIKFCSQANCDPMFGALGEGVIETHDNMTGKIIDTSAAAIKKRAEFVKAKCQQYFGDDKHCLHWDIGNEPPSPDQNCYFYATDLIPTAIRTIKQVIPNAIFHAPELYLDSAKARYWDDVQKFGFIGKQSANASPKNYKNLRRI